MAKLRDGIEAPSDGIFENLNMTESSTNNSKRMHIDSNFAMHL